MAKRLIAEVVGLRRVSPTAFEVQYEVVGTNKRITRDMIDFEAKKLRIGNMIQLEVSEADYFKIAVNI